jgi:RNA polymerase sigma-70 factor (ECF subfamily)
MLMGAVRVLSLPTTPAVAATAWRAEEAFRSFYAATARPLWAYLRAACGDRAMADDLLQESYLRLLAAELAYEEEGGRRAYLYRIASNLLRDHWRRRRREPEAAPIDDEHGALAAETGDPGGLAIDVQRALARLSLRERQLLWLAHVEGRSHRELARTLGLVPGSVRVLLFRARRRLATQLGAATAAEAP